MGHCGASVYGMPSAASFALHFVFVVVCQAKCQVSTDVWSPDSSKAFFYQPPCSPHWKRHRRQGKWGGRLAKTPVWPAVPNFSWPKRNRLLTSLLCCARWIRSITSIISCVVPHMVQHKSVGGVVTVWVRLMVWWSPGNVVNLSDQLWSTDISSSFDLQQPCCDNTCGLRTSGYVNVMMYQ